MHHYFEAITNTSGDSLVGYFARVIDPATQNTVTMSADDNGTPIVTKSGVDNMGSTDDYGNLDFYVVPGTYHLDIYAPNATSFIFRVPNVAMNSSKGDIGPEGPPGETGANGSAAASLAQLKSAPTDGPDIMYDSSVWSWNTGNFSGQADDANFVASNLSGKPLSNGAWVRKNTPIVTSSSALATSAARQAPAGGVIKLAPGSFAGATISTRRESIVGEGMSTTTVNPVGTNGIAFRLNDGIGSWDYSAVRNLGIIGTGTRQGTGVKFGPDAYQPGAEYIGRHVVEGVKFDNLDIGIDRPWGGIGAIFKDLNFSTCNYHMKATSYAGGGGALGDQQHAGCNPVTDSHFSGSQIASDYIDGRQGGATQVIRRGNIHEFNVGHVHYYRGATNQNGGQATHLVDEYIEGNNTAVSVTTADGVTMPPAWLAARDCDLMIADNCGVGRTILVNSAFITQASDLSLSVDSLTSMDSASTWVNYNARCYSGKAPGLTYSISQAQNLPSLATATFEMPMPVAPVVPTGNVVLSWNAQGPQNFDGGGGYTLTTLTSGGGLPWLQNTQKFDLDAGATRLPSTGFNAAANQYVVLKYVARKLFGNGINVQLTGGAGLGGPVVVNNAEMRTHVGVFRAPPGGASGMFLYHTPVSGASSIEIAGYEVTVHATIQEALARANAHVFATEPRPVYTVTNGTAARSVNADAGSPADLAALTTEFVALRRLVATLLQDQQIGRTPR
jgi:hypothetical protein